MPTGPDPVGQSGLGPRLLLVARRSYAVAEIRPEETGLRVGAVDGRLLPCWNGENCPDAKYYPHWCSSCGNVGGGEVNSLLGCGASSSRLDRKSMSSLGAMPMQVSRGTRKLK